MSTIGYGDITPTNNTEKIFIMFMTINACGIFGKKYIKNKFTYFIIIVISLCY